MIATSLHAIRYDDVDYSGTTPAEHLENVEDIGVRWSIVGGLQRMEVTVRARSDLDGWDRYQNHLGHRIAVYDKFADRHIAGQVYEISPSQDWRTITYICAGPWKRTADDYYALADFPATGNTDAIIKDILTDSVSIANSDQTNIDGSSVAIGAWNPLERHNHSPPASTAIMELAEIGDNSNNAMDFYFVDTPFNGTQLQKPLPYLKARSTTASPDWMFERADLAPGGLSLSRNIWDLRRDVWIGHGRISGTHTGSNGRNLIDSGASFENGKVSVGDRVVNRTQNKVFTVLTIASGTQLNINQNDAGNWVTNDVYTIDYKGSLPNWVNTGTSTETDLWSVYYSEYRSEFDTTQGGLYGDMVMAQYEKPIQQQAFVISAPTIRDGNGSRWPLWRPLMGDSFYFRITDLYPEAAVFDASDDRSQTFMAVAMDYTYRNNRLRVVPASSDSRLDVLIKQALADQRTISEFISTEVARKKI